MNIAVLGTGSVGQVIGSRLVELGHTVIMGSRSTQNAQAQQWLQDQPAGQATVAEFSDAAAQAELIWNCTNGLYSVEIFTAIPAKALSGKIIVDLANLLDAKDGHCLATAERVLGVMLQKACPGAHVVKTLNTVNRYIMARPTLIPGPHSVFLSGDNAEAKAKVTEILATFGWQKQCIIDLGGIETAVGPEMYLSLWLGLRQTPGLTQPPHHYLNLHVVTD